MKREATVACVIWSSLGCGAAADRVDEASVDGSARATSPDGAANDNSQTHGQRRICDGSAGIRLAVGYWSGGMLAPWTYVLSELGFDFLYVDGNCRYWAHAPLSDADDYHLWRPYREGTLTPADEQRLHDAVSYDGIAQERCSPDTAALDGPQTFLWDGREFRSCASDSLNASRPLRAALYDVATAVTGPMRIQVGKEFYSEASTVYEWPLGTSVERFVINYGETRSFAVDDPEATAALRALRERAIADAEASSGYFLGVIPIRSPEEEPMYFMSVRDDLPFVGADGSWRPAL